MRYDCLSPSPPYHTVNLFYFKPFKIIKNCLNNFIFL